MHKSSENIQENPTRNRTNSIEGSKSYYKIDKDNMHKLEQAIIAYRYVVDFLASQLRPELLQPKPTDVAILGGFYSARGNIEKFHLLAQEMNIPLDQLLYIDFNAEPQKVLSDEEKKKFHQINLKDIATALGPDSQPLIKPGSVKVIVLDHVTEFMDDETLQEFMKGLSVVLAPDGVALMAVIEVKVRFWHQLWRKVFMGMPTQPRKREEWRAAANENLKIPLEVDYPAGNRTATLFVLTRKDSLYPDETREMRRNGEELTNFDVKKQKSEEERLRGTTH